MKSKALTTIIDIASVLIILCAVVVMLSVVFTRSGEVPRIGGYSLMCVVSGSMEPEIPTNSLVLVKETPADEVEKGDIISFYSSDPALDGAINTHRVVDIKTVDGELEFVTRGDANGFTDQYTAKAKFLVGKVAHVSPSLGILVKLSSNPLIFIPLIIVPLLIMLLLGIRRTVLVAREIERQEQEAALRRIISKIKEETAELEAAAEAELTEDENSQNTNQNKGIDQ